MKRSLLILILFSLLTGIQAQKEANYWYFGIHAGLNFGLGVPVALTNGALSTGEGCSSISSSAGNLILYTDGRFVYDKNNNQMPNGYGLLGNSSSTESGLIVPKPLDPNNFYVFTVDAYENNLAQGVCYSRVDMTLNNGNGDVVVSEKNVSLVPLTCEKITAVGHSDGVSYWLITHKWGTDEFYSYRITSAGVNTTPVISHAGPVMTGNMQQAKGYLKVSPDGTLIAMANNTAFNIVLCHYNTTTGQVSYILTDDRFTNPGGGDPGGPYGVEFSSNSKRLYISEWKQNRKIYQYDVSNLDPTTLLNSRIVVASVAQNADPIGCLQLGPDNRMYVARMDSPYLSRINQPNTLGMGCGFVDNAVNLAGRQSQYGLPPFIQSFFYLTADFYWDTPLCYGGPAQFYTSASDDPDSVLWNFGDPASGPNNTSRLINPTHEFTHTPNGMFAVTLIVYLYGNAKTVLHIIVIHNPPNVYIGSDTTICSTTPFTIEAEPGFETYLWQNGDTNEFIQVDQTGWYWCEVTGEGGCPDRDSLYLVFNYAPTNDAGPDKYIPSGTSTTLEGAVSGGSGDFSYLWEPESLLIDAHVLQPTTVNLTSTNIFTFTVTDNQGGCVTEDEAMVFITGGVLTCNPTADPSAICIGGQSQLLSLISGGGGSYTYDWTSTPSGFSSNLADPVVAPTVTTTYHLTVSDTYGSVASGSTTLTVHTLPVANAGPDQSVIYGTPALLLGSASGGSGAYIYHWEPASKLQNPNIPQPTTVYLTVSTSFTLTVTDAQTGCICDAPDEVIVNITGTALTANPTVVPEVICSGEPAHLYALPGGGTENYSYSWTSSPPGFTSTLSDPVVTPYSTTSYTVTVSDGYNTVSNSTTLTVNPSPVINLGPDEIVCVFDTIVLDAGNPGCNYIWSNGSTERTVQVASVGIGFDMKTYSVTVTSPEGCQTEAQRTITFDFSQCSGIGENETSSLHLYPNPGNGLIKVENTGATGSYFISVTDMYGTKVLDNLPVCFSSDNNTVSLDLSGNPPGIYLVRIVDRDNKTIASKYFLAK